MSSYSFSSSSSSSSRRQWKKRVTAAGDAQTATTSTTATAAAPPAHAHTLDQKSTKHDEAPNVNSQHGGARARARGRGAGAGAGRGHGRGHGGARAGLSNQHHDHHQHDYGDMKQPQLKPKPQSEPSQHDQQDGDDVNTDVSNSEHASGGGSSRQRRSRRGRGHGRGGASQAQPETSHHHSDNDSPFAHIHDLSNNPVTSSSHHAAAPSKVSCEPSRTRPQQGSRRPHPRPRPVVSESASMLTSTITEHLLSGTYDCSICSECVGKKGAIWSCPRCFIVVHQRCINKWYRTKIQQTGSKLLGEQSWHCPGCLYLFVDPPSEYTCWCGKITDPEPNPYLIPHSCGGICGRQRGVDCPHPCTELCHPGTCAPCPAMGALRKCPCGTLEYQLRCGEIEKTRRTCDTVCDKPLSCKNHTCQRACHIEPCGECQQTITQTCFCGKETTERPCGSGIVGADGISHYTCTNACAKKLSCGNHSCTRPCHIGPCSPCARLPIAPQPCACGASTTSINRSSCLDPLPTCASRCNKLLSCQHHTCTQPCHDSPCRPCTTIVKRTCECKQSVISIPCMEVKENQAIRCGKICKIKLACGRHICNERCCSSEINPGHLCLLVCNKDSPCGVHKCDRFCHLGPCPPCAVVFRDGIPCRCGATRIPGPVTCGTEPPQCKKPCSIPRPCGHPCAYTCHQGECPPCAVLVTRMCIGNHREVKNIRCSSTAPSCGITCKKPLSCGQHTCKRVCHGGECIMPSTAESKEQKIWGKSTSTTPTSNGGCNQKCGEKRFYCEHTCKALCHPNKPCPDMKCDELVTVYCACHRLSRDVKCGCGASQETPPSQLDCDDICEVEARNARFRLALSVEDRPHIPYPTVLLEHILDLDVGKHVPKMEQILNDFIAKPLSMSQRTKTLPPMNSHQRWLLHQMASYYNIESESFDPEPRRSIRLIRQSNSAQPSMLLSQAIRLFIPYRRDPAQSNAVETTRILHFYHLNQHPAISPKDLRLCLKPWDGQYRLNWLDHTHAFATFHDANLCAQAKAALEKKGIFRFEEEVLPGTTTKLERQLTSAPTTTTRTTTSSTSSSSSSSSSSTTSKPILSEFAQSFYAAAASNGTDSSTSSSPPLTSTTSSSPSITSSIPPSSSISPYIAAYRPPEFQPVKTRNKSKTRTTTTTTASTKRRDAWDDERQTDTVKSTWDSEEENEQTRDTHGSWRRDDSNDDEEDSESTPVPTLASSSSTASKKPVPKPVAGNKFGAFLLDEDQD